MEMKMATMVIMAIVLIVSSMFEVSSAAGICNMSEDGLNTCRPAVTASNPVPPTQTCCDALKSADLQCFCDYKNSSPFLLSAFGIDPTLAMQLPAKCNIPSPPNC
ncbi:hypothetical protein CsatB_024795 [Cannabis sativa]